LFAVQMWGEKHTSKLFSNKFDNRRGGLFILIRLKAAVGQRVGKRCPIGGYVNMGWRIESKKTPDAKVPQ